LSITIPPVPIGEKENSYLWTQWYLKLQQLLSTSGSISWALIDTAGSNLTDIATRDHASLQNMQGGASGERYHLTAAEYAALGGGAGADVKQTEVDFGSTGVDEASFTVADAAVTALSHLLATTAYVAPTGKDLDELDMDSLEIKIAPGIGQFTMYIKSLEGPVHGNFKINYLVG
jgi:hypothetical protein